MSVSRSSATAIARRYATAMFDLARDAKQKDALVAEISAVADAIEQHDELAQAMSSPLLGKAKKSAILGDLAGKAGALTLQALATVAEQGRAEMLPAIAQSLRVMLAEAKGELIAQVESARPLADSVQKQLAESLSKATGKTVRLELKITPELLGGVAVQIGSQRLDASLSAALSTMRRELLALNA